MNNQDYEQKKSECWEEYTRKCVHEGKSAYGAFNFAFDRAFALGVDAALPFADRLTKCRAAASCAGWPGSMRDRVWSQALRNPKTDDERRIQDYAIGLGDAYSRHYQQLLLGPDLPPDRTLYIFTARDIATAYAVGWLDRESAHEPVEIIIKRKKK